MPKTLTPALTLSVGSPMRQFRFVPFALGRGRRGLLAVHAGCAEDDPAPGMFFLPTDTLKLTAFTAEGERLWHKDLGGGVIPGIWFCPVLPFDLDGDGADEIWLVNNADPDHALNHRRYVLQRLSAATGEVCEERPWPPYEERVPLFALYRYFIAGAQSHGRPRLVTAQGTYGPMRLQCWDERLEPLWQRRIEREDPGARGSHMSPVLDLDGDGRDELLWGERCIDLDTGEDRWVADAATWGGHSDVIQPTRDRATGRWSIYTCRENANADTREPRVALYDDRGRRAWGQLTDGHMDMGWTARLAEDGSHLAYALAIGTKTAGPGGFQRGGVTEYLFDLAGRARPVDFPLFMSLPVDFDGDGRHELAYMGGERRGLVADRTGRPIYGLEGEPAYGGKLLDAPGEQIVTWSEDGTVRLYACPGAEDRPAALERYGHPYYAQCLRLWATGYNRANLGGL